MKSSRAPTLWQLSLSCKADWNLSAKYLMKSVARRDNQFRIFRRNVPWSTCFCIGGVVQHNSTYVPILGLRLCSKVKTSGTQCRHKLLPAHISTSVANLALPLLQLWACSNRQQTVVNLTCVYSFIHYLRQLRHVAHTCCTSRKNTMYNMSPSVFVCCWSNKLFRSNRTHSVA